MRFVVWAPSIKNPGYGTCMTATLALYFKFLNERLEVLLSAETYDHLIEC